MSDQIKLQAAKEFIQEKKYEIAKSILEQMPETPTAKKWLEKLSAVPLSDRVSGQISTLSEFELMEQLDNDEAFKELILRIHKYRWNYNYDSMSKIQEKLPQLFEAANENVQKLQRLCVLVRQFDIWQEHDPIIEHFTRLLRSEDFGIRPFGAEALRYTNTLIAERNLWAYPMGADDQEKAGIKIIESKNEKNSLKLYRVIENGQELFSMRIVRENGKFRTTYPDHELLTKYFHLIALVDRIADEEIDMMIADEQYEQDMRDGWDTYIHDIAPWENDD